MLYEYVTGKNLAFASALFVGAALTVTQVGWVGFGGFTLTFVASRLLPFSLPWEK